MTEEAEILSAEFDTLEEPGSNKTGNIIRSMHNSWRALCRQYAGAPDESVRIAMNMVSKIIGRIETEYKEAEKKKQETCQISTEEWLAWLNN